MPSSRSRHSARSPITEVPYDVLREIFIHCLPRRALKTYHGQPNTTIAPMLLCQICSCWRTITLASPSLWSHLSYRIIAQDGSWAVRQKDIDFMTWWKRNQGSMAPLLHLDVRLKTVYGTQDLPLAEDGMAFLLKYMTSARYLKVNRFFWERILDKLAVGDQVIFRDLHTLVTDRQDPDFYRAQVLIGLVPTDTPSALRRLFINCCAMPVDAIIPNHWSSLTHLSMHEIAIYMTSWFSLVQALPDLQWASIHFNFAFDDEYDIEDYTEPPTKYTLPQLSTLLLTCGEHSSDYIAFPLTLLFSNLHLPALQTLSLSSWADSWEEHHIISDIYALLRSTPAVTTLALRETNFLSLFKTSYPAILSEIGDIEPIWSHAPHLTHLQLDLPWFGYFSSSNAERKLDTFVCNIFLPNCRWLALNDPACAIQTVTLYVGRGMHAYFDTIRDLTLSSILRRTGGASNIIFEIILVTDDNSDMGGYREWGSRNY